MRVFCDIDRHHRPDCASGYHSLRIRLVTDTIRGEMHVKPANIRRVEKRKVWLIYTCPRKHSIP